MKNGCFWPRGKMLGGSHAINAMIYFRGNERDFNDWESLGNPSWGWEDSLKYFRKAESNGNAKFVAFQSGRYHNDSGPLRVESYNKLDELSQAFINAAAEFGYAFIDDINADTLLGYVELQGTLRNGRRESTARSYLVPAKDRPNLHVIKHAYVHKINIDDKRQVTGLKFQYNNEHELEATIRKEVVVSAGAINSPQLLMLSGIGPKEHLTKLGIPVKKDLPVGRNLQDHVIVPLFFQFHKSTAEEVTLQQKMDNLYEFIMHKTGPLTGIGLVNLAGLINTINNTGFPDIELQHFSYKRNSDDLKLYLDTIELQNYIQKPVLNANKNGDVIIVIVELLRPKSIGYIELKTTKASDQPRIFPNYLEDVTDVETLLRGVKFQARFVNTKAFKEEEGILIRLPLQDCDTFAYQSDDYWRCYISYLTTTVYHPVGTNKMGPKSDETAVVNARLKVHGVTGLRVMDASVMPKMVSANTNAATIMIAEKGSDFIKEDWLINNNHRDEF